MAAYMNLLGWAIAFGFLGNRNSTDYKSVCILFLGSVRIKNTASDVSMFRIFAILKINDDDKNM